MAIGTTRKAVWMGVFLISALITLIAILLLWGSSAFMGQKVTYSMYFNRSVKGLSVGAPMMFRGVTIGHVTEMRLAPSSSGEAIGADQEGNQSGCCPVQVFVNIDATKLQTKFNTDDPFWEQLIQQSKNRLYASSMIQTWIRELVWHGGVRAQLQTLSLLTGQLYVELNFCPGDVMTQDEEAMLARRVLPTRLSSLDKFQQQMARGGLSDSVESLKKILRILGDFAASGKAGAMLDNLYATSGEIRQASQKINAIAASGVEFTHSGTMEKLPRLTESIQTLLAQARDILASGQITQSLSNIQATTEKLKQATEKTIPLLESSQALMKQIAQDASKDSTARKELFDAIRELNRMAQSMRALSEMLQRSPESLLYGR